MNNLENYPDFLTPDELAEYMRIDTQDILRSLEKGQIPGIKIGEHWRIPKTSLITMLGMKLPTKLRTSRTTTSQSTGGTLQDIVKREMNRLLSNESTAEDLILNLQDSVYCKKHFNMNYPVLLQYDHKKDMKEQGLDSKGYRRYWTHIFPRNFLVCSQWYKRQRPLFEAWLKSQNK